MGGTVSPKRVQRLPGEALPPGAVYVGNGTRWANPWKVNEQIVLRTGTALQSFSLSEADTVALYRLSLSSRSVHDSPAVARLPFGPGPLESLTGKDLACWCPLEWEGGRPFPCHADVLLELANPTTDTPMSREERGGARE